MRNSRWWLLFAVCSLAWLVLQLLLAPHMSGIDVYYFRDAGWNLAQSGSFESAALARSQDLLPHFYAHYTPLMPLLFAGYLAVFPSNPYAGTVFNYLLGLAAAATLFYWILRQRPGRLRAGSALVVALASPVFVTHDRPEALGLALAAIAIAAATAPRPRPVLCGMLAALAFLAHPLSAVLACIWISALFLEHATAHSSRWTAPLRQVILLGLSAASGVAVVAFIYYRIDPTSISRFVTNAFLVNNQVSVGEGAHNLSGFVHQHLHINSSPVQVLAYALSVFSFLLLAAWCAARRKSLRASGWIPIAAAFFCVLFAFTLFPGHPHYVRFLSILVPAALLIATAGDGSLRTPALALVIYGAVVNLPALAIQLVQSAEQLPSYRAARSQPSQLRAQMPSPDGIVALNGDSYDVFKPEFHHLVGLLYVHDKDHYAGVDAVANCYDAFHGPDNAIAPLPARLDASEFRLIQPAPAHLAITLFGHRVMRGQWGYGCDLYVRNRAPQPSTPPQSQGR